jgi:signal transduction histidine kinase
MEAHPGDIDFRTEVIDAAVENSRQLFDSRDIRLEVDAPEGLPAKADPELMRIVVGNFLSNAAKYGRENGTARLKVFTKEDRLVVDVWNEGEGFSAEEREQLFKKFSRLRNAAAARKRGSGLGLFLCRQIVEMHGGTVNAESEPGSWADFSFSIPLRR